MNNINKKVSFLFIVKMSSNKVLKLYNARLNVLEQLEEINYDVSEYKNFSINAVDVMYDNKQMDMLVKRETDNKKVYIHFVEEKTLGKKNLDELIEELFEIENALSVEDTLIVIANDEPKDTLISRLKYTWEQSKYMVVVHNIKRLQYNLLKHQYVPPCSVLNEEEVSVFKQKFNIQNNKQLPEISRFDPQALAICLRPGDIVEFERKSETAMKYNYYRVCVN